MNICVRPEQYEQNNVCFCEPIRNNIMNEGNFIRILYSTKHFTLNGIYLLLQLTDTTIDKHYNKYKCTFAVDAHTYMISKIQEIEETLLQKINIEDKIPQNKITEQLLLGNIKIFSETLPKSSGEFILKISGVWETKLHYGLTFKFVKIDSIM
jgi:hypothetical protein